MEVKSFFSTFFITLNPQNKTVMKNITFLLTFLYFSLSQAQIVNIPDANFKASLLSYQPAIDTNNDSEIQLSEALAITTLDFVNVWWFAGQPQNVTGLEAFTNLTTLALPAYNITTLDLTALTQLQNLNINACYQLTTLNLTGLTNLINFSCSSCYELTSLDVSGFANLQTLNLSGCNNLTSLNLSGLSNLQTLNCSDCYHLPSLNLSGLTNLQTLDCSFCSYLTVLDLTGLSNLTSVKSTNCYRNASLITTGANNIVYLDCNANALTTLNVTGMTNLQYLDCGDQQDLTTFPSGNLTNLDLTGLNGLTTLICRSNGLTQLNISHLTNLTKLICSYNQITSLNVVPLVNLTQFYCGGNPIATLDVSTLVHLTNLDCHSCSLAALNIDNLTALTNIDCGQNSIPSLNVANNNALTFLACAGNELTTLNISNLVNLTDLICSGNQLTTLDFSSSHNLDRIEVGWNLFETLDFSQTIQTLNGSPYYSISGNQNLTYVNLKNGSNMTYGSISAYDCPNLQYICADENNLSIIQENVNSPSPDNTPDNVQVNSYCTFVPGGLHNTITGTVTLDNNNNGCGTNDIHPRDFKVNINDGTVSGATFSLADGSYEFYTQAGSFVLTPQFQNSYFTVSPATATLNFANLDESTQTQNFCITANGVHNDVDIILIPAGNARPGFDAHYVVVFKNKGNQILSGTVNLAFDDGVFDFVSATPALDNQSTNNLSWNYSNLLPFESRTISITLNLNGPMENPAVNIGDVLSFIATVNPIAGDETPDDNTNNFVQTVNGSFDPNDKTCLEGNFIRPENVGDYLNYVIRFQNSGTAAAENVVVRDIIDATKFDINTLQLISASHPQVTRVTGNKIEFVFEGINLPAEIDDEPGSHGYVAFKIKTHSNLVLGNNIANTADIYFDYNFPVTTNTTSTTVSNLGNHNVDGISISVVPNPVKNTLTITAKDVITSVQLFDVQGRLIATKVNAAMEANLDVSQQRAGVYFVKVWTDNGMQVEKIIKE